MVSSGEVTGSQSGGRAEDRLGAAWTAARNRGLQHLGQEGMVARAWLAWFTLSLPIVTPDVPAFLSPGPPALTVLEDQGTSGVSATAASRAETPGSSSDGAVSSRGSLLSRNGAFRAPFAESSPPSTFPWTAGLAAAASLLLLVAGSIYLARRLHGEKEVENEEKETACQELGKEDVEKEKERQIREQLQEELRWRRSLLHAADVVLDPATAHPELSLTEDGRSVRRGPRRRSVPDNPERFDCRPCVLGLDRFSSGRHYWEVEVESVMVWAVGVCRDDVERKGEALLVPQNGFWTLEMFGNQYRALASPEKVLPLRERLRRVGVFLDHEAGDVSFYNMRDRSHIYTCPRAPFSGPLRPFFRLGSDDSPLFICPAFTGARGVTVPEDGLVLHRAGTGRSQRDQFPGLGAK